MPVLLAGLILLNGLLLAGCREPAEYPRRPITLVCPWAAGGGTDRVSRQLAVHLQQELGVPVNVINATGGKGVTGHSRGLTARPDGYTLTMATVELNMMHWSGLTTRNWRDCVPVMSINEDYAALFVQRDAPWRTLAELEAEIVARPGQLKASGTASGGIWHLGLAGWLQHKGLRADDVVWVSSQGAGPSLQELMSGGLDMVCCSLPEARSLYESGEVRTLGVMAPARADGFPEVPTFAEQGTDWSLGGWRGLALPVGTPVERVARVTRAMQRIVSGETQVVQAGTHGDQGQTFAQFMQQQGFDHTCRPGPEFAAFLAEQDQKFGHLLGSDAMRSVRRDPFPAWAFPSAVGAGLLVVLVLLVVPALIRRKGSEQPDPEAPGIETQGPPTGRGILQFLAVVGGMLLYLVAAEQLGFVLTIGLLLATLLCLFGTRWPLSLLLAAVLSTGIYQVFAHVLRVPLPRGILGW